MELDIFERLFEGIINRTYSLEMTGKETEGGKDGFQISGFSNWTQRCHLLRKQTAEEQQIIKMFLSQ